MRGNKRKECFFLKISRKAGWKTGETRNGDWEEFCRGSKIYHRMAMMTGVLFSRGREQSRRRRFGQLPPDSVVPPLSLRRRARECGVEWSMTSPVKTAAMTSWISVRSPTSPAKLRLKTPSFRRAHRRLVSIHSSFHLRFLTCYYSRIPVQVRRASSVLFFRSVLRRFHYN